MEDQTFRFSARPSKARIDWALLSSCEPESIRSANDVDGLERVLETVCFGDVTAEARTLTGAQLVKLCRLAQLMIEYLLFVQETLAAHKTQLQGAAVEALRAAETARSEAGSQLEEARRLRRELRGARKALRTYETLEALRAGVPTEQLLERAVSELAAGAGEGGAAGAAAAQALRQELERAAANRGAADTTRADAVAGLVAAAEARGEARARSSAEAAQSAMSAEAVRAWSVERAQLRERCAALERRAEAAEAEALEGGRRCAEAESAAARARAETGQATELSARLMEEGEAARMQVQQLQAALQAAETGAGGSSGGGSEDELAALRVRLAQAELDCGALRGELSGQQEAAQREVDAHTARAAAEAEAQALKAQLLAASLALRAAEAAAAAARAQLEEVSSARLQAPAAAPQHSQAQAEEDGQMQAASRHLRARGRWQAAMARVSPAWAKKQSAPKFGAVALALVRAHGEHKRALAARLAAPEARSAFEERRRRVAEQLSGMGGRG